MKKSGLILIVLLLISIIGSGCEIKRSEEELREEIKAELEAELAAEEAAKEEAAKEEAAKIEVEVANNQSEIEDDKTLMVMTERLNVRRDPVLDSNKVGLITNEKTIDYIDEEVRTDGYKWYKVMYEPEAEGWIAGWYTMKDVEFTKGVGRGHLKNAYDGRIDGMLNGIGDNISEVQKAKGPEESKDGFNGGEVYTYPGMNLFLYGDMGGDIEVGDIAMITYFGQQDLYGINVSMTKEEVISTLGDPDVIENDVTDEYTNLYENNDLHKYYTGSYIVQLVYDGQGQLVRIEIM